MTKHMTPRTADLDRHDFSRRELLGAAAGLTLALTVAPDPLAFVG